MTLMPRIEPLLSTAFPEFNLDVWAQIGFGRHPWGRDGRDSADGSAYGGPTSTNMLQ